MKEDLTDFITPEIAEKLGVAGFEGEKAQLLRSIRDRYFEHVDRRYDDYAKTDSDLEDFWPYPVVGQIWMVDLDATSPQAFEISKLDPSTYEYSTKVVMPNQWSKLGDVVEHRHTWPPEDSVLVHGPGAPWGLRGVGIRYTNHIHYLVGNPHVIQIDGHDFIKPSDIRRPAQS